mmetsp:Transcript_35253/g.47333  ORF Transcript_35253/g.47333 Transcript_35253/m.47333 type:complete len:95 (-) Transcript_35253:818-1102(-)
MALVQKYGSKDWLSICSNLPSRNRKQCRDRFMNHLRQKVKKGSWTQEEDNLIFEWQKKVGNKCMHATSIKMYCAIRKCVVLIFLGLLPFFPNMT